jgi:superfamily II DNA or RNA helicase
VNTALVLVHSKDIAYKIYDTLIKHGFKGVGEWTGRRHQLGRITVATMQSYVEIEQQHTDVFDVLIVDEAHHISTFSGQYAQILGNIKSPVRLGLTATLPYLPEAQFALESFIGPVIGEYTIAEGTEDGFLAKPEVTMFDAPHVPYWKLNDTSWLKPDQSYPSKYQLHYKNGIVLNEERNLDICEDIANAYQDAEIILVNIERIEHGYILVKLLKQYYPDVDPLFAQGKTEHREYIVDAMDKGEIKCVIATRIFNEGIDIPSLSCVINAAGGLSPIQVYQKIGRGTRTGKDGQKKSVKIIDYFDTSSEILKKHSNARLAIYKKNGWIQ